MGELNLNPGHCPNLSPAQFRALICRDSYFIGQFVALPLRKLAHLQVIAEVSDGLEAVPESGGIETGS